MLHMWRHAAQSSTRHAELQRMQAEVDARAADYSTFFKKIVGRRSDPSETEVGTALGALAGEVNRSLKGRAAGLTEASRSGTQPPQAGGDPSAEPEGSLSLALSLSP